MIRFCYWLVTVRRVEAKYAVRPHASTSCQYRKLGSSAIHSLQTFLFLGLPGLILPAPSSVKLRDNFAIMLSSSQGMLLPFSALLLL